MLHLHKKFLNFNMDVIHLALRLSILDTLCYLAYLYLPGHHPGFIFAASAIFLNSIVETIGINGPTKHRLYSGVWLSCLGGIVLILGSLASMHILAMSIGIVLFMSIAALSSTTNIVTATLILMVAAMFITGSNFPTELSGSIGYGISFTLGGLIMTLSGYIHSLYYATQFDLSNKEAAKHPPIFNFNLAHRYFALRLSFAVLGSYLLATLIHRHQAYWVPMTVLIVLKIDNDFTWMRIRQRFAGTFYGSILAIIVICFIHDKLLLTALLLPVNFLIIISLARHYGAYAFFLTAMVTISFNIVEPLGMLITEDRGINTIIGVCIVALVTYVSHRISHKPKTI